MGSEKSDFIPCSHCRGYGRLPLTGIYADTLARLREQDGEVTAGELARLMDCAHTAMLNRLVALEAFGLATVRNYGQHKFWRAAKKGRL